MNLPSSTMPRRCRSTPLSYGCSMMSAWLEDATGEDVVTGGTLGGPRRRSRGRLRRAGAPGPPPAPRGARLHRVAASLPRTRYRDALEEVADIGVGLAERVSRADDGDPVGRADTRAINDRLGYEARPRVDFNEAPLDEIEAGLKLAPGQRWSSRALRPLDEHQLRARAGSGRRPCGSVSATACVRLCALSCDDPLPGATNGTVPRGGVEAGAGLRSRVAVGRRGEHLRLPLGERLALEDLAEQRHAARRRYKPARSGLDEGVDAIGADAEVAVDLGGGLALDEDARTSATRSRSAASRMIRSVPGSPTVGRSRGLDQAAEVSSAGRSLCPTTSDDRSRR